MEDTTKKIIITGVSAFVGYALNQAAHNRWRKMYDEEPPTTYPSDKINWKKVILWSIITGTVISSAKLATKRYLTLKLEA